MRRSLLARRSPWGCSTAFFIHTETNYHNIGGVPNIASRYPPYGLIYLSTYRMLFRGPMGPESQSDHYLPLVKMKTEVVAVTNLYHIVFQHIV